jgi:signal transduction histidine kinase
MRCAPVLTSNPTAAPGPPDRSKLLRDLSAHLKPADLFARLQPFDDAPRQDNTTVVMTNPANNLFNGVQQQVANAPNVGQQGPYVVQPQPPADKQEVAQQKMDPEFVGRAGVKNKVQQELNYRGNNDPDDWAAALANTWANGERWFSQSKLGKPASKGQPVAVGLGSMAPIWLTGDDGVERLVVARLVHIGDKQVCQGLLLDWDRLQNTLRETLTLVEEGEELFPEARFIPVREGLLPEDNTGAMTSLPVILDPGARPTAIMPTWTPLRIGLALAWAAALVALLAVGLGGWTLLELSARRIRFVSAVTHELRTPLTTLRLYLDMLTGGIVQDEKQKAEYLHTLHTETERLNRLVGNVLDFSRLENQRPRLEMSSIGVSELLERVREAWQGRCEGCDKLLIVEDRTEAGRSITTDVRLVPQVLGNLLDNACKYSQGADDRRIWLRAFAEGTKLVLEVEDRGPGVAPRERRAIFRAFRRGHGTDTTGGVGLGLALAQRWAGVLGGKLTLRSPDTGACFRLELPGR